MLTLLFLGMDIYSIDVVMVMLTTFRTHHADLSTNYDKIKYFEARFSSH